jgi:autotransporter-associated beta strand protein
VQGDSAVFSASTLGATGSFNVTLSQNVMVANLTYTGGSPGSQLSLSVGGGNAIMMQNLQMTVAVDANTTLFVQPAIVSGGLGGSLVLQSGNLILAGANTYGGGTTINAGSNLQIGDGVTTGSILGKTGTGALTIGDSNSTQYTVALTNLANDYAGGTTITGGATVVVDSNSELGSGVLTLAGGTLQTANGFTSGRAITLVPGVVANTLVTQFESTSTYTGEIGGSGGLTIAGGGTVVLADVNNYIGGTHILFAILRVAHDTNLGNVNGGITLEGGTLLTTTDGFTSARPILWRNDGHQRRDSQRQ